MEALNTDIIRQGSIQEVILKRDRAIEMFHKAIDMMYQAGKIANDAAQCSYAAPSFDRMSFSYGDGATEKDKARQEIDKAVWRYLLGISGLRNVMDAQAYREFNNQLDKDPPEVTLDNLTATFSNLGAQSGDLFRRGLVNAFVNLDYSTYKTNDAFKIGKKVIVTYAMSPHGGFSYYGRKREAITDLDRIFHILDGKEPKDHLADASALIAQADRNGDQTLETEYFRFKWFKNGNIHIELRRPDLVTDANKLIAEHFGQVLRQAR